MVGGWTEDGGGGRALVSSVDCLDLSSPSPVWGTVTHMPTPRYHAGVAVAGEEIIIYFNILVFHTE